MSALSQPGKAEYFDWLNDINIFLKVTTEWLIYKRYDTHTPFLHALERGVCKDHCNIQLKDKQNTLNYKEDPQDF